MNKVSLSLKLPLPFSIAGVSSFRNVYSFDTKLGTRLVSIQDSVHQRLDQFDCFIDCSFDRRAQSHLAFFASERLRFTSDQQNILQFDIHGSSHAQNIHRIHGMGFHRRPGELPDRPHALGRGR